MRKGLVVFFVILLFVGYVSSALGLTPEEERALREDGLVIGNEARLIGTGRTFSRNDVSEDGFVKIEGDDHFSTKNTEIKTGSDLTIKTSGRETHVVFDSSVDTSNLDCYIQVTGDDKVKNIKMKGNEFNVKYDSKNPPSFSLDDNCNLAEGTKFVTKEEDYELQGYETSLPEGSIVEYEKEKVVVSVDSGSEVNPRIKDGVEPKGVLEIRTKEEGGLMTPRGKFQALEKRTEGENAGKYKKVQSSIFYSYEGGKLRAHYKSSVAVFYNDKNEVDFSIFNPRAGSNNPEVELVFEGTHVSEKRPSVLITDSQIGSSSFNGEGPVINLGGSNRWGVGSKSDPLKPDKKTVSFQGIDGFAVLKRGADGKIPTLKLSGNSIYGPDKRSFFGKKDSNKFYYKNAPKIKLGNHGDGTTFLRVVGVDKDGKEFPFEIFSNEENKQVAVPEGKLNGPFGYFVGKKGTVVSNAVVVNELTPEARQMLTELSREEQTQIKNQIGSRGPAALETTLKKVSLTRNPLRASVSLNGCSGTIVGYSRNGNPLVLTAAHCFRGLGSSSRLAWLNSNKNNMMSELYRDDGAGGIPMQVVAYSTRDPNNRNAYPDYMDLALAELNPTQTQLEEIKKRGYIRIAPPSFLLQSGDPVQMIGCPTYNYDVQKNCQITGISQSTGTNTLWSDANTTPGRSGGGLFKGRYLVGVIQSEGGSFGNLKSIYKLLDESGYSYVYRFILIFDIKINLF